MTARNVKTPEGRGVTATAITTATSTGRRRSSASSPAHSDPRRARDGDEGAITQQDHDGGQTQQHHGPERRTPSLGVRQRRAGRNSDDRGQSRAGEQHRDGTCRLRRLDDDPHGRPTRSRGTRHRPAPRTPRLTSSTQKTRRGAPTACAAMKAKSSSTRVRRGAQRLANTRPWSGRRSPCRPRECRRQQGRGGRIDVEIGRKGKEKASEHELAGALGEDRQARTGTSKGMEHPDTKTPLESLRARNSRREKGRQGCGERTTCTRAAIYGLSDSGLTPPR